MASSVSHGVVGTTRSAEETAFLTAFDVVPRHETAVSAPSYFNSCTWLSALLAPYGKSSRCALVSFCDVTDTFSSIFDFCCHPAYYPIIRLQLTMHARPLRKFLLDTLRTHPHPTLLNAIHRFPSGLPAHHPRERSPLFAVAQPLAHEALVSSVIRPAYHAPRPRQIRSRLICRSRLELRLDEGRSSQFSHSCLGSPRPPRKRPHGDKTGRGDRIPRCRRCHRCCPNSGLVLTPHSSAAHMHQEVHTHKNNQGNHVITRTTHRRSSTVV